MVGAVINPQQTTRTVDMSTGQTPSMSHMNSYRISALVDRLLSYVRGGSRNDSNEFFNLCISLSRAIDIAIANNEIPIKAPELPGLLKQVCQWKNDTPLQAAIMVLLLSLKSACRNGWFNEKDKEELQKLFIEISRSFCSDKDMNSKENTFHHNISPIMLRFYPSMKMGEVLAFVEATPGYGAYVKDFDITTKAKSLDDKIYLFVAQIDDTETSSCIISPQQVNFLLNGKPVDGRNCVYKDPGPQTPTLVTNMLKSGTNLLQVLGHFSGKYIIIVAFMSTVSNPICPTLPNYVPPAVTTTDPDNEIIEGPSTISLNCPISFKRITTPVKGNLCKHLQCFDYENYVDMNTRRPSWRCPHCSQSVCFTEIRVDRIMVKVLNEVGKNVSHVKISNDGSWEAVNESDDYSDKPQPSHQKTTSSDTMDLTQADNYKNAINQEIDKKPSLEQLQNHVNKPNNQIPTSANIYNPITSVPSHTENIPSNTKAPPVQNYVLQSQSQGKYHRPGMHVRRIPIAVQALPAQPQTNNTGIGFDTNPHQMRGRLGSTPQHNMGPQGASGYGYNNPGHHQVDHQFNSLPHGHMSQQVHPTTTSVVKNLYAMSAAQQQQPFHISGWTPSMSVPMQEHGAPRMLEGDQQSWQPSGRMRGSLSGQAYVDALNQYMYFPTQPVQAARPPPPFNTPRPVIPPHLQYLMANNNRNMMGASQDPENWRF